MDSTWFLDGAVMELLPFVSLGYEKASNSQTLSKA
jgi:hypothetical protein